MGVPMLVWSLSVAHAFPGADRYPVCADVTVAEKGAVRIRVPLSLRSADDPPDGSDLVLFDGEGRQVPFARLEGDPGRTEPIAPTVAATLDPFTFRLEPGVLPVDEVRVELPMGVPAAQVTIRAGEEVVGGGLVWALPETQNPSVAIRPTTAPLLVTVRPTTDATNLGTGPSFRVIRRRIAPIARESFEVVVDPPVVQENGYARVVVPLPQPLQVDHLTVRIAEPIFSRQAGVVADPWSEPAAGLRSEVYPNGTSAITRVQLGDLSVENTTLDGPWPATDRLSLVVASEGMAPLTVEKVTVSVDGVHLVALDAGPGPHVLCGGAAPGTTVVSDLTVAAPELGRMASDVVEPGDVRPNPDWVPEEVRANLASPGVELALSPFRYQRPVVGSGLVRIGLPNDVLTDARPDLGDLRLVSDGRQIPYLLRRRAEDPLVDGVTTERVEKGEQSRIAVHLPTEGLRISRVRLSTPATVFDRQVTVSLPRGTTLEPLRTVRWVGRDRPGTLTLDLQQPVDDELLVTVENGDDPPLPVEGVEVWVDAWEVLAVVPETGADLVYGAPGVDPPEYDLWLVQQALSRRPSAEATLGERLELRKVPLSAVDRILLAIGVGVLGLGLLGLGADLVRRLPAGRGVDTKPA